MHQSIARGSFTPIFQHLPYFLLSGSCGLALPLSGFAESKSNKPNQISVTQQQEMYYFHIKECQNRNTVIIKPRMRPSPVDGVTLDTTVSGNDLLLPTLLQPRRLALFLYLTLPYPVFLQEVLDYNSKIHHEPFHTPQLHIFLSLSWAAIILLK